MLRGLPAGGILEPVGNVMLLVCNILCLVGYLVQAGVYPSGDFVLVWDFGNSPRSSGPEELKDGWSVEPNASQASGDCGGYETGDCSIA